MFYFIFVSIKIILYRGVKDMLKVENGKYRVSCFFRGFDRYG